MAGVLLEAAGTIPGLNLCGFVDVQDATKLDVVFDCTIPEAHYEVTITTLKHDGELEALSLWGLP